MSRIPFPISDNWNDAKPQIEELIRILFEERIGGLKAGSDLAISGDSLSLSTRPRFYVHKGGTDQTIPHNEYTLITWSTVVFDSDSGFANNRFTVKTAGKYLFAANLFYGTSVDQKIYRAILYKNGAGIQLSGVSSSGTGDSVPALSCLISAAVGDYFEIYTAQNQGTDSDIEGSSSLSWFSGVLLDYD